MSVASSHYSHRTGTGTDASSADVVSGGIALASSAASNVAMSSSSASSSAHGQRQRLGSVGESVPASDSSEGTASETFEHTAHWALGHQQQLQQQHNDNTSILRHHQLQQQQQHRPQSTYRLSGSSSQHMMAHSAIQQQQQLQHHHQLQHQHQHQHLGHDEVDEACASVSVMHDDDDDDAPVTEDCEEDACEASELGLDSLSLENSGVLSELERGQVESFFSGLGTEIFVCPSLANLYENCGPNDWRLVYTGVPVLLHDKGSTRSRSAPRVTLVLAERGTCFALWQDRIDGMSEYKIGGPAFHTMCLSSDHAKLIGFSYDSNQAAQDTWHIVQKLIADPANDQLAAGGGRKRAAKQPKRPKPAPLPPKSQISAPCQFQHVTSVTAVDAPRYFSLQAFVNGVVSSARHRSH